MGCGFSALALFAYPLGRSGDGGAPARVAVEVADEGPGMDADHARRVFERFYRADSARDRDHGGSGIGLAIAKAFIDAHGGHLNVLSEGPESGTTFVVALPIEPETRTTNRHLRCQ